MDGGNLAVQAPVLISSQGTEFIGNDEYGGLYENEDNVWEYVGANVKIYRNLYYVALGYVVGDGNLFDEHQFYMQLGFHFTLGFGHVN